MPSVLASGGPQFATIVMDQCQMPGAKLGVAAGDPISPGIRIKEDCRCDFAEAGEKCEIHDKKGSE